MARNADTLLIAPGLGVDDGRNKEPAQNQGREKPLKWQGRRLVPVVETGEQVCVLGRENGASGRYQYLSYLSTALLCLRVRPCGDMSPKEHWTESTRINSVAVVVAARYTVERRGAAPVCLSEELTSRPEPSLTFKLPLPWRKE
ncbi:hypothetical protein J6590_003959 [Homalodisca vitripennis]|nr:hypothetical protein J6590_003959 [Homalodisca vitripennis]